MSKSIQHRISPGDGFTTKVESILSNEALVRAADSLLPYVVERHVESIVRQNIHVIESMVEEHLRDRRLVEEQLRKAVATAAEQFVREMFDTVKREGDALDEIIETHDEVRFEEDLHG